MLLPYQQLFKYIKNLILLIFFILFSLQVSKAQDSIYSIIAFKNISIIKSNDPEPKTLVVAFFNLSGNSETKNIDILISDINRINGVKSFKIFYNRICKIVMEPSVTAESIRQFLIDYNLDFDIESVDTSDPKIKSELIDKKRLSPVSDITMLIPPDEWIYPENFPKYIDTGNPQLDEENLANAKQEWIKNNPDAYKKMTGVYHVGK